jgi:outer membrane protein OmpA-like peptidoglycan-associated protein
MNRGSRSPIGRADLVRARTYRMIFGATDAEIYPGNTALGTSRAVLEDLREVGVAELSVVAGQDLLGTVATAFGVEDLFPLTGRLTRIDEGASAVPVLLNGSRVWLPALHVRGTLSGLVDSLHAQFWFLNDPENPLALRAAVGDTRLQVVRIDYPVPSTATVLERALESKTRPVELFGVYFEFDSAEILPPSEAVIAEVVAVMRRHPDWKFRIEGHTDDLGGDEHNLDLSRRRAAAVADALIERLDGAKGRLVAVGYGETRPREPNDTLEGRARNRRVELIRI